MKSFTVLLATLCLVLAVAQVKDTDHAEIKFGDDVKNIDINKLATNWYQIAASKEFHSKIKGCGCNALSFSVLKDDKEKNKLLGISHCKMPETGDMKSLNFTARQIGKSNGFRIEFIETDIKPIKKEVNETEASKVKPIKDESIKDKKDDTSKKADGTHVEKSSEKADANAFIAKLDANYSHFVLVTPNIKGAYVLSKEKTMDENTLKQYTDFLSQHGYTNLVKIDHSAASKC